MIFLLLIASTAHDPTLTPGVIDPAVTQANIQQTICIHGYTSTVRNVSAATKRAVVKAYRDAYPNWPPPPYEVDHLISIEIGGDNDQKNLWPQPLAEARKKDVAENRLHRAVCKGTMTLAEAQEAIKKWSEWNTDQQW